MRKKETSSNGESWIRKLWKGWMTFARVIGNFNSKLILTVFYFLIVGVVSLLPFWQIEW